MIGLIEKWSEEGALPSSSHWNDSKWQAFKELIEVKKAILYPLLGERNEALGLLSVDGHPECACSQCDELRERVRICNKAIGLIEEKL